LTTSSRRMGAAGLTSTLRTRRWVRRSGAGRRPRPAAARGRRARSCCLCRLERCAKTRFVYTKSYLTPVYTKIIIMPRQARDRHRKNSKKLRHKAFSCSETIRFTSPCGCQSTAFRLACRWAASSPRCISTLPARNRSWFGAAASLKVWKRLTVSHLWRQTLSTVSI
jgi:hypothetical protein